MEIYILYCWNCSTFVSFLILSRQRERQTKLTKSADLFIKKCYEDAFQTHDFSPIEVSSIVGRIRIIVTIIFSEI